MLHKKVGFETDLNLYFLYHYFVCMDMLVSCLKQINENISGFPNHCKLCASSFFCCESQNTILFCFLVDFNTEDGYNILT